MKPEENYLDDLFQSARSEEPQLSYEEVADSFLSNTSPTLVAPEKNWFWKNINLNSFFLMVVGVISIGFLWSSFSEKSTLENEKITDAVTIPTPTSSSVQETILVSSSEKSIAKEESKNQIKVKEETVKIISQKELKPVFPKIENSKSYNFFVETSPSITTIPVSKIEKTSDSKIKMNLKNQATTRLNNTFTKATKEESQSKINPRINTTLTSPWVVGEESTNPDWAIVQQQPHRYYLGEKELVLQKMLDCKYLEKIFEKENGENFEPLSMASNYNLFGIKYVNFKGSKITIIDKDGTPDYDPDFDYSKPHISVSKFKVKKKKAILKFKYDGHSIFIQLKKVDNKWTYHKIKSQHNVKNTALDITF